MPYILGIDTGGTNTDGVIIDCDTKEILHTSKAFTTKNDLTIGVRACIENMHFFEFSQIKLVSLSTTLATNAVVEGKTCEAGLLIIGEKPDGKLPVKHCLELQGTIDIKGRVTADLDKAQCHAGIEGLAGKVDAIAISGYASIRNPVHELELKKMVGQILGVPVVCAHELSNVLGFYERTVTAALNAQLIPIIRGLINSIETVLNEKGIHAPIMIVKGDGTLMSTSVAKERPIETILSGPAASVIGGKFLSGGINDGIIIDMGGTTSDIASMENGVVKIKKDGATVGGWQTRVQAADLYTYGIGGDSHLRFDRFGNVLAGPRRVIPLCAAGTTYPKLEQELKLNYENNYQNTFFQNCDCFMLVKDPCFELSGAERDLLNLLRKEPHSFLYLSKETRSIHHIHALKKLVDHGVVAQISFTPTDILHIQEKFNQWNKDVSLAGAAILANTLGRSIDEVVSSAEEAVIEKLFMICLKSIACFEDCDLDFDKSMEAHYLLERALNENRGKYLKTALYLERPIIAIGAPAENWIGRVAEKLNAKLISPEHAGVACAVGAAVGQVIETLNVLIRPGDESTGYVLYAPWERRHFGSLEDAMTYALRDAKAHLKENVERAGSKDYKLLETWEHIESKTSDHKKIYIETRIQVTAIGFPSWN